MALTVAKLSFAALICCAIIAKHSGLTAEKLMCNYCKDSYWKAPENLYICEVKNTTVFSGQRVTVDDAEGEHEAGKSNDDVQGIVIQNIPNLKRLPANLSNVFNNLILIRIYKADLSDLTQGDLKSFTKLKFFYCYFNNLKFIHSNLFINNPLIEILVIEGSNVEHIERNALSGLTNLKGISLYGNTCRHFSFAISKERILEILNKIETGICQSPSYSTYNREFSSWSHEEDGEHKQTE